MYIFNESDCNKGICLLRKNASDSDGINGRIMVNYLTGK